MRYTRYDLKRKKKSGWLTLTVIFLIIIVMAFIIGTGLSNFLVKNSKGNGLKINNDKKSIVSEDKNTTDKNLKSVKYVAIQGGMYAKKENADETVKILSEFGTPFCIQEGNLTRVFLGIYNEEEADKISKNLTSKNIENSKMFFEFQTNDLCNAEINEIIDAHIKVLTKLNDKSVRAIKTDELKKWSLSLKEVEKNSGNYEILNDLKNNIKKLPDELTKDKITENNILLYNSLKKVGKK